MPDGATVEALSGRFSLWKADDVAGTILVRSIVCVFDKRPI